MTGASRAGAEEEGMARGRGAVEPDVGRRRWRRTVLAVGLIAGGPGALWGMNVWVERYSAPFVHDSAETVPPRTVAIVPGARVLRDGTPTAVLADRLEAALALHGRGAVQRILVSGDHGSSGYDEVHGMRQWLLEHGVPSEDIFLDHAGLRTLDTMERAARVFAVRDAVVCTQRFHMARALFLARRAGLDAVGLVADRRGYVAAPKDALREVAARARAFLDSYVFAAGPQHLGPMIPIDGDARASHDRTTQRP